MQEKTDKQEIKIASKADVHPHGNKEGKKIHCQEQWEYILKNDKNREQKQEENSLKKRQKL